MRRRDKLKNIERANLLAEQRYLKSKGIITESESTHPIKQALKELHPTFGESIYGMTVRQLNHPWGEYKMMFNYNNGSIASVNENGQYTCWRPQSIRGGGDELSKNEVYEIITKALTMAGYKTNASIGVTCGQINENEGLITEDEGSQGGNSMERLKQALIKLSPDFGNAIFTDATGFIGHPWSDQKMMSTSNNGAIAVVDEKGHYHCFPCKGYIRGHHNQISNSDAFEMVQQAAREAGFVTGSIGVKCGSGNKHGMD